MPDLSNLETLVARIAAIDFSQSSNEQATREMAVNPVISELNWDTFNPDEVVREFAVRGGKVDYCLRRQKRNFVLIEVKRTGTDLAEHQEQLLRYAFNEGVKLAALTDGLIWWLYLPMAEGSWEQRRFFRVNFREQSPADAASAIHRFLNRDGLTSGEALKKAEREFESQERDRRVRVALQEAWQRVLRDPHGLLRDLLAETVKEVSGHIPSQETVTEFLQGLLESESTEDPLPISARHIKDRHVADQELAHSPPKKAKKQMSTRVLDSQLSVKFADNEIGRWALPDRSDKAEIRRVRDAAVAFALEHGASDPGQTNAVRKALTDAGYYLKGPKGTVPGSGP